LEAEMQLDLDDPFEYACALMIETHRVKRADYASDDEPFKNFEVVAQMMQLEGYDRMADCLTMVIRKVGRIVNLRGAEPENESLLDSYKDLAVYGTLLYCMASEDGGWEELEE
jgi:hypothetical protein